MFDKSVRPATFVPPNGHVVDLGQGVHVHFLGGSKSMKRGHVPQDMHLHVHNFKFPFHAVSKAVERLKSGSASAVAPSQNGGWQSGSRSSV
eukprot:1490554-Rhodomonas_salina.3